MTDHEKYAHVCDMVKKTNPDFDPEKQYALWLIMDLYVPYGVDELEGVVKLYDVNNQEILWGEMTHSVQLIRHPYPNKNIYHIAGRYRNRRTTGLFLTTDHMDDLTRIHRICVQWRVYIPEFDMNGCIVGRNLYVRQTDSFITIQASDKPCWYVYSNRDRMDDLYCDAGPRYLCEKWDVCFRRDMKLIPDDCSLPSIECMPLQYVSDEKLLDIDLLQMQMTEMGMPAFDDFTYVVLDYGASSKVIKAEDAQMLIHGGVHKEHRAFLYF